MSSYESFPASAGVARERTDSRAVFGQVMGLVAFTVAFAAAGAYIGRDLSSGAGWIAFIAAIGCIFGLDVAASPGRARDRLHRRDGLTLGPERRRVGGTRAARDRAAFRARPAAGSLRGPDLR